jgi:hypothetical protein
MPERAQSKTHRFFRRPRVFTISAWGGVFVVDASFIAVGLKQTRLKLTETVDRFAYIPKQNLRPLSLSELCVLCDSSRVVAATLRGEKDCAHVELNFNKLSPPRQGKE